MTPIGYVMMQQAEKMGRSVIAYRRWAERIPRVYSEELLGRECRSMEERENGNRLGLIKHYRSLVPMAQEVKKPIFHLLAADGAIGSHQKGVSEARDNFRQVALEIADRCKIMVPEF